MKKNVKNVKKRFFTSLGQMSGNQHASAFASTYGSSSRRLFASTVPLLAASLAIVHCMHSCLQLQRCHLTPFSPLAIITPPPIGSAEYCDERVCLSVCLSACVCLSAIISPGLHVRSPPNDVCACYLWLWLGPSRTA